MRIARVFDGPGWTGDQYDTLISRMELGGHNAEGGVLDHWATHTGEGVRAVDVYTSSEAAGRLAAEKIGPIATELG